MVNRRSRKPAKKSQQRAHSRPAGRRRPKEQETGMDQETALPAGRRAEEDGVETENPEKE